MFWFPAMTNGVTQMDGCWYISWPCFPGLKQNTAGLVGGETQNSPLLFVPFVSRKRSFILRSKVWWVALIIIILSTLAWYKKLFSLPFPLQEEKNYNGRAQSINLNLKCQLQIIEKILTTSRLQTIFEFIKSKLPQVKFIKPKKFQKFLLNNPETRRNN